MYNTVREREISSFLVSVVAFFVCHSISGGPIEQKLGSSISAGFQESSVLFSEARHSSYSPKNKNKKPAFRSWTKSYFLKLGVFFFVSFFSFPNFTNPLSFSDPIPPYPTPKSKKGKT